MPEPKHSDAPAPPFLKLFTSRDALAKAGILITLSALLAAMFPVGAPLELKYTVGGVWAQKDLIAPFAFPIHRDQLVYDRDVEQVRKSVYPVFIRSDEIASERLAALATLVDLVREAVTLRGKMTSGAGTASDSTRLGTILATIEIPFTGAEWEILATLQQQERLGPLKERLSGVGRKYWDAGILDQRKQAIGRKEVAVRTGSEELIQRVDALYDADELMTALHAELALTYGNDPRLLALAHRIAAVFVRPNLLYDSDATNQAIAAGVEAIPRTAGYVQESERIISKHERITDETRLKLESLRRARAERSGEESQAAQFGGIILHMLVVLILFGIYLGLFRKRIFGSNRKILLVALLIAIQGFFAFLTREVETDLPLEYLIAVPVTSMLLAILFDSRVAFYGTVVVAFIVAGIRGNDYSIALASLVAGALSVYTVRDIRNRTQIFRSMGFIFLGYAAAIVALALERFADPGRVTIQLSLALVNGLISPVLTYGLLIFFERVFRMTTDLTLIELSDSNHPLLRQLAEKAPGTYHHSMTIASLAENAARAIGANDILARTGAYFHDIGKISKPAYFVENQRGSRSRHDRLPARTSAAIIHDHVANGVALARKYGLPQEIIDCIPMHHGTTMAEFFYNKALKEAESHGESAEHAGVREGDFRYAGPKPQTKETGILMLADAIEARVRSLDDHSSALLKETIDEVVKKRFEEGELDECPLTLKDLTKIREAFLRVLVGVYHARVKYPETKKSRRPGGRRTTSGEQE
jgi:putative nucleotidyltransferase with HDIG domain